MAGISRKDWLSADFDKVVMIPRSLIHNYFFIVLSGLRWVTQEITMKVKGADDNLRPLDCDSLLNDDHTAHTGMDVADVGVHTGVFEGQ